MKRKWFAGMLTLIIALLFVNMPSSFFVQALTIEQNEVGIPDFYLYNELLMIANQGLETPYLKLETDALSLKEEITITNNQIESLEGLEQLNLSSLKRLNLSGNKIKTIDSISLSGLIALEELNLSFNELTQINLPNFTSLNVLELEHNKLSTINLSRITSHLINGNGYVNLKNNEFNALNQITLPSELSDPILVDLNNNYFINETPSLYTQTHTLELLLQGVKKDDRLLEGSLIQVYETNYYENFNVKIYDNQENLIAEIIEGQTLELAPNQYELNYYDEQTLLYSQVTQLPKEFTPITFHITLQKPIITVNINNEVVPAQPTYKEPITLKLSAYNLNASIYYSVNGSVWQEGDEIILQKNGQYTIRVRTGLLEMSSEIYQISLNINESWQNTVNVIKAMASLTGIILIFIAGYLYYSKKTKK